MNTMTNTTTLAYLTSTPTSPFHSRIAAMVCIARGDTDLLARVSFLEGLLRLPKGSRTKGNLRGALEDLRGEVSPKVWKSPRDEEKFFNPNSSVDLDDAIRRGVQQVQRKHKYWIGDTGRQSIDEVVQNLLMGFNLATGTMAAQGPIARRSGLVLSRARNLSTAGIWGTVKENSYDQALALVPRRAPPLRGDQPVGEDEDSDTLFDQQISQWSVDSEADVAMALNSEGILARIDGCMQRRISEAMFPVWEAILSDPSLIITDSRGNVGVKAKALAMTMKRLSGKIISGSVAARNFKGAVLPAIERCLNSSPVLRQLRNDREIQELIREERSRRYSSLATRVSHRYACGGECPCEGCQAHQDSSEEAAQAGAVHPNAQPKTFKQRMNPKRVTPPKGGETMSSPPGGT